MTKAKSKAPSQSAGRRVNFYVREYVNVKDDFEMLAEVLHGEGVRGVYNGDGVPNKSAILQHLIDDKLGRPPAKSGDSID